MKVIKKLKHFSRDIKLIIITTLIMSCIGVYAAGVCIVSATSDDITYNNSTVTEALNELYTLAQDHCPVGYECSELPSLYEMIANNSVLDDRASTYVTSSSGIDFNQISSDTNGKGIYEIASTKNDTYPIYYYRGAVANNNVKFAGFCWKIVRTTDTGGVKLIYNGEPNGSGNCTNTTGENTQIGSSVFNTNHNSFAYVGYMYGPSYLTTSKKYSESDPSYVYGSDVTYSGGKYTLTNTTTYKWTSGSISSILNNYHYTCLSTGTTCTSVYYIHYTALTNTSGTIYYITLTNGKKVENALDEMLNGSNVNTTNSTVKTTIESWYNINLTSYTSYIEDTFYCNDRTIGFLAGWDPNGGDATRFMYLSAGTRLFTTHTPSLKCTSALDKFTVSSSKGNGKLTYPVGLITNDEVMYAGGKNSTSNNTYYLYNAKSYWTMSPLGGRSDASGTIVHTNGYLYNSVVSSSYGLRPVITLNFSVTSTSIASGDGTSTNPYVIKTN